MGSGNYKLQDISTRHVFVSRDVIFEEGRPRHTLMSVGEQIPLFDNLISPNVNTPLTTVPTKAPVPAITEDPHTPVPVDQLDIPERRDQSDISKNHRGTASIHPSKSSL